MILSIVAILSCSFFFVIMCKEIKKQQNTQFLLDNSNAQCERLSNTCNHFSNRIDSLLIEKNKLLEENEKLQNWFNNKCIEYLDLLDQIESYKKNELENSMPLKKGAEAKTKKGFSSNVKEEMKTKPKAQSLAIAYSEAGEKKKPKKK